MLFCFFLWDSNMISVSTVDFRYYVVIIILVKLGRRQRQLRLISFQWSVESKAGRWISDTTFCVLYVILSKFLSKDVLERAANPTYLKDVVSKLSFILFLKITLCLILMFNTIHNIECWKYWNGLRWYKLLRVKSESLNHPFLG